MRSWRTLGESQRWWLAVAGLLLITLLTRLPFRSRVPINWDAVQYILGVRHFDVADHQPHPPGNPLYIFFGKGLHRFIADPNQALIAFSIITSLLAVLGTALIGRRVAGRAAGLWVGGLVAANPLFWFYGEVALSYVPEIAVGTFVALAAWHAYHHPGTRAALVVGVAFAVAGGVRPTVLPLLGLLWLFGLWRLSWKDRAVAVLATLAGCLVWAIPLVSMTGGPLGYWRQLHWLTESAVEPTSLLKGPSLRWLHQLVEVGVAVAVALNLFGLLVLLALIKRSSRRKPAWPRLSTRTIFLCAWLIPPLVEFTLVHFGQWGYLLLILPPSLLLGLLAIERLAPLGSRLGAGLLSGSIVVSLLIFLVTPAIHATTPPFQPTRAAIRANDATWLAVQRYVDSLPTRQTIILTSADGLHSFRIASYLLPRYDVIGVGRDWDGDWGTMYYADNGHSTYHLDPKLRAQEWVPVSDVAYVVALDEVVIQKIADQPLWSRLTLADGAPMLARSPLVSPEYLSFFGGRIQLVSGTAFSASVPSESGGPIEHPSFP